MKRSVMAAFAVLVAVTAWSPKARATTDSLQDWAVNVNGTVSDFNNPLDADPTFLPGMNVSGFSTVEWAVPGIQV